MTTQKLANSIKNTIFNKSTFVSTFLIYITVLFIGMVSFIELRKNIIPDVTINFLIVLELFLILNFVVSYVNIYNSLNKNKWLSLGFNIIFFIGVLTINYFTLSTLITQTASFVSYSILLLITSVLLYLQVYLGEKKGKNYLIFVTIFNFFFFLAVYTFNYIFGNTIFGANQFIISQKQVNDFLLFSSFCILIIMIYTLFNILRIYIPDIKSIDQNNINE
jgi:hypothetical protein